MISKLWAFHNKNKTLLITLFKIRYRFDYKLIFSPNGQKTLIFDYKTICNVLAIYLCVVSSVYILHLLLTNLFLGLFPLSWRVKIFLRILKPFFNYTSTSKLKFSSFYIDTCIRSFIYQTYIRHFIFFLCTYNIHIY